MSADKYAQFIAEQQKKLSVSGTNPVNLIEKKELSDKQKDIAKLAGDKDEIDADDLKKLRSKKKDDDDDKDGDKDDDDKDDDKPAFLKKKVDEDYDQKAADRAIGMKYAEKASKKAVKDDPMNSKWHKQYATAFSKEAKKAQKKAVTGMEEEAEIDESKDATKNVSKMLASKGKTLVRNKTGLAVLRNAKKDNKATDSESRAMWTWGIPNKSMLGKPKKTVKEEASYISEEESQYIEEMVGKGKLPEIADFHKKAADHAYKMRVHHQMMADKSEDVGDSEGFDHHIEQAMRHDYDHEHHMARFDHAASLKARNQAHKDLKAAKDKAAKARDAKRDWA